MEPEALLFPQRLHFTCKACAGCCHTLEAVATQAEVDRFASFDWSAARARMRDRDLLRKGPDGLYRLNHYDGACVFLDEDNLCAIHKELGYDAKPFMCKHFPLHLTGVPEGTLVSFDFSCPTVIADEGAPIETQADEVRRSVAEWHQVGAELRTAMVSATMGSHAEPSIQARRGVPLGWADYLALEQGIVDVLGEAGVPFTERLLRCDRLVESAADHAAPGAMQAWLDDQRARGWRAFASDGARGRVSPMRQRAVVAPVVASIEEGWGQRFGGRASAGSRLEIAFAILRSGAAIPLATADNASLDLARMLRTRFPQDDPQLTPALVRYLTAFVLRKGLINGTSVLQGSRNFALFFSAIRWYAVARATLAGRDQATEADVRYAIQIVEKTLTRTPSLRDPNFIGLLNMLFRWVTPARSLYLSTYPA